MTNSRTELGERYRRQLIDGIGGWSGSLITAIPTVVFVAVNAAASLRWAIISAIGSAVVLAVYRAARKQSLQQVLSGLIGVLIASLIAARTGQAKGYFLLGIWSSFLYGGVFLASMLARRPLVGLAWEFIDPAARGEDDPPWHQRPLLQRAYQLATLAGVALFLARGAVQLALYERNSTGWLAVARIVMGYPLFVAALGFAVWIVARARRRLAADAADAQPTPSEP